MIPVYSRRMLDAQSITSADAPLVFACPSGFVSVVKSITMTIGIDLGACQASVRGASGGRIMLATNDESGSPLGRTIVWYGSYAFIFGEAIAFTVDSGGTWDVTASGYVLPAN